MASAVAGDMPVHRNTGVHPVWIVISKPDLKKKPQPVQNEGWPSFVPVVEVIIPVSLIMAILQWSGWLGNVYHYLEPAISFLNLPPEAAFPIITGILIGQYAVIAILTIVPFSPEQMTLIAIFALVAHNLIIEGIVQHRSGFHLVRAFLLRIIAAIVLVFVVSQFFSGTAEKVTMTVTVAAKPIFLALLGSWSIGTVILLAKILGIIMFVMILLQICKSLGWIEKMNRPVRPLTRTFGFSSSLATGYVVGTVFGLLYGSAVVIDEAKKEGIDRQELRYLHASLSINHSMVEDPLLFALLGLNLFWLWIPRLIMAVVVVQGYRLVHRLTSMPIAIPSCSSRGQSPVMLPSMRHSSAFTVGFASLRRFDG